MTRKVTTHEEFVAELREDWRFRFWDAVYSPYFTLISWRIRLMSWIKGVIWKSTTRISKTDDGVLDYVYMGNCSSIHLERMDFDLWCIAIYPTKGERIVVWFRGGAQIEEP